MTQQRAGRLSHLPATTMNAPSQALRGCRDNMQPSAAGT